MNEHTSPVSMACFAEDKFGRVSAVHGYGKDEHSARRDMEATVEVYHLTKLPNTEYTTYQGFRIVTNLKERSFSHVPVSEVV